MARVLHVNCAKCGGTLGLADIDRVVKCRYCSINSLVDFGEMTPEYYVKPKIKETEARRKLTALLRDREMPKALLKEARYHSARLYFMPYHELSGRRLGTMKVTEFKRVGPPRMVEDVHMTASGVVVNMKREDTYSTPKEKTVDTRVVMSDVTRLEPAVRLAEWGLEEADIGAIRSDAAGMLQPMNRRTVEFLGKIYEPSIKPDQMIAQAKYYIQGVFRHEPHPFHKSKERKFNPLQMITYIGLLGVLLPLQGITGMMMWMVQKIPSIQTWFGGLPFLAPMHTLMAWLFASFIVGHVYLTTTGATPLEAMRGMVTGWEEVEVHGHVEMKETTPLVE